MNEMASASGPDAFEQSADPGQPELDGALTKVEKSGAVGLAIAAEANIDADVQAGAFYAGFGFEYLHPNVSTSAERGLSRRSPRVPWPSEINRNWQVGQARAQTRSRYGNA
jgi:hypothetical protein